MGILIKISNTRMVPRCQVLGYLSTGAYIPYRLLVPNGIPRNMYQVGSAEYKHHVVTYGPQKKFGYKDFIPMFRAEKFDPQAWVASV